MTTNTTTTTAATPHNSNSNFMAGMIHPGPPVCPLLRQRGRVRGLQRRSLRFVVPLLFGVALSTDCIVLITASCNAKTRISRQSSRVSGLVKTKGSYLEKASLDLFKDREFMLGLVEFKGSYLEKASQDLFKAQWAAKCH